MQVVFTVLDVSVVFSCCRVFDHVKLVVVILMLVMLMGASGFDWFDALLLQDLLLVLVLMLSVLVFNRSH